MKTGRVALVYLIAFASIIVPVVSILLYAILTFQTPFAVQVSADANADYWRNMGQKTPGLERLERVDPARYADAKQVVEVQFRAGGHATLIEYPPTLDLSDRISKIWVEMPTNSTLAVLDRYISYQRSDTSLYGVMFFDGPWLLISEAATEEGRIEQLKALPALRAQEASPMIALGEKHLGALLAAIGVYCVILIFVWPRLASWAASIDRAEGVAPVSPTQLRERLMAINALAVPFSVLPGKRDDELLVEWKYADAQWIGVMAAGGVKSMARIKLRLDPEANRVRAQDTLYSIKWQAAGAAAPAARISASWFRGIVFHQYDAGFIGGLIIEEDGHPKLGAGYTWRFTLNEMKNPLIETIRASGWDWKPVVSFVRFING